MRGSKVRIAAGVFFVAVMAIAASAGARPVNLDSDFNQCMTCIDGLKKQLAHVSMLGNVFTLVGAAMAAIGSVVAGASKGGKQSWIAGFVGVTGAIVTALPKTLPDRAELQQRISLADQHRVSGEKTMRQLSLLGDGNAAPEWERYAISRFIDCSANDPAKDVPELPAQAGGQHLVASAAGPTAGGAAAGDKTQAPPAAADASSPTRLAALSRPPAAAGSAAAAAPAAQPAVRHLPPTGPPVAQVRVPDDAPAAAAAAKPAPAGGIFRTAEECKALPDDDAEHQRKRCVLCVTESPPHHYDLGAPFGHRCRSE
jgi:hypothetical protein